ncbi:glycosyltransferase family 4 protein [Salibaculum halophilum]|uniref:glycosyltransferase family 4 protein n=1 Tax=Salibaculum halophilum TaxID=1914408 RepID=UPI000A11CE72|nr:glycosyltransferase family 4 protein [Salibaculum halophilum]
MTRRRAAFAIPGDITTATGGFIYERRLLEALRHEGHDVTHLRLGTSFPDPDAEDTADAVEQLQDLAPDRVVILDGFVSATLDTEALAALHVPSVAMVHHPLALEVGLESERRDHLFRHERANLARIDHVFVPSPATAEVLTRSYDVAADRITVLRPGAHRPTGPRAPVAPPLILSVGILHPRKGHDVLLTALARITHLDWTAVIAGKSHDADHAAALDRLHADLGLGGRVRIAGYLSDADLSALYWQAAVFALATRYEGYGLVFDEALAHGLPIVSCRAGAVPDTVPTAAGHLVAPEDDAAFADALAGLLTDTAAYRRCAEAAEAAGRALPTWADTARTAGAVLDRL